MKSVGPGLDACRSGDLNRLKEVHASGEWDASTARDRHGSGPMLWAAGGGEFLFFFPLFIFFHLLFLFFPSEDGDNVLMPSLTIQ